MARGTYSLHIDSEIPIVSLAVLVRREAMQQNLGGRKTENGVSGQPTNHHSSKLISRQDSKISSVA